jgi:hypothetical protein
MYVLWIFFFLLLFFWLSNPDWSIKWILIISILIWIPFIPLEMFHNSVAYAMEMFAYVLAKVMEMLKIMAEQVFTNGIAMFQKLKGAH